MFLFISYPIFSVEFPDNAKAKTYNLTLSLGIASGGSIGIGKVQYCERSTKELIANFHYLINSDYFVTGIYGQINSYRNKQRVGFFTLFRAGVDYTKGEKKLLIIFGPYEGDNDKKKFEGIFPNLVIGCGYSIKLAQNNRMLIYVDLGLKKTFSNLNLSITF